LKVAHTLKKVSLDASNLAKTFPQQAQMKYVVATRSRKYFLEGVATM